MPLGVPLSSVRSGVSFATSLAHFGDATALICRDGESLTYRKLAARVDEAAALLGTDERRLVLVAGANAVEPIVAYLAALAGGHPVLLAPGDRPEVLERMVETYDPDVVAAESSIAERREGTAHELDPELALLLSTSGSSGSPKLVRLSRENVESNAEAIGAYLQIRSTDRAATTLPMHYCYGLSVVNSHLARGAALVLSDLSVVDGCFWELFRRERATSFAGVPYTFELLERVGFAELDLPHLRYVTQAGGRMAPEQVARWAAHGRAHGWDLFVMYGQTEATARMAYLPPDLACAHPAAIGVPIPGGSFSIAPVDGTADDVGELIYSGPNVMLGYAYSPADLALGRTIESLRTGDLARRGADGLYEIVGRRSRFVKVLGLRIDLDRTEALLGAACAGDDERLVVALEDERDPAAVRQRATQELGVPARAMRVLRVAELPRLPSGKPDHAAIAALGATTAEPRRDAPPRDLLPGCSPSCSIGRRRPSRTRSRASAATRCRTSRCRSSWSRRSATSRRAGTSRRSASSRPRPTRDAHGAAPSRRACCCGRWRSSASSARTRACSRSSAARTCSWPSPASTSRASSSARRRGWSGCAHSRAASRGSSCRASRGSR